MSILVRITVAGLLALGVSVSAQAKAEPETPAVAEDSLVQSEVGTAVCGHVGSLVAAQEALRRDDRATALAHLKEARRILSACDDRGVPEESGKASLPI